MSLIQNSLKFTKCLPSYDIYEPSDCHLFYCLDNDKLYLIMGDLPTEDIWKKCANQIIPLGDNYDWTEEAKNSYYSNILNHTVHLYAGEGKIDIDDNRLHHTNLTAANRIYTNKCGIFNITKFDVEGNRVGEMVSEHQFPHVKINLESSKISIEF